MTNSLHTVHKRQPFTFQDICSECDILEAPYTLDRAPLGVRITVPLALQGQYPFNSTAYGFLQELRQTIYTYGLIEFPHLPVNKINHTLAQRAPHQHQYSDNPFLTGEYQHPHQDTPPLPTAFWLSKPRKHYATWVISTEGLAAYRAMASRAPHMSAEALHQHLVPASIQGQTGLLLNQTPGLLLLDNSHHRSLYHGRTACVSSSCAIQDEPPMYAYNETGLLHYIDTLDSRRGTDNRCEKDKQQVTQFLEASS